VTEQDRIALLAKLFPAIGDDCAVLEGSLVWTVDACVEHVHFRREWLSWEDVGWKSFMAAASDIAAMGGRPLGALSALVLTDDVDDAALEALARGQAEAASALAMAIVGGNLARGSEVSVTTTVLGRADRPIPRNGAKPGDRVLVAGALGHAAAGLAALREERMQDAHIAAWRRPRALVAEGLAMAKGGANAAIDVSDGFALDVSRLARASGVRVVLDELALAAYGVALEHVLHGGEDYAIVATSPSPIAGFAEVGRVVEGAGVMLGGRPVAARGFDHFSPPRT